MLKSISIRIKNSLKVAITIAVIGALISILQAAVFDDLDSYLLTDIVKLWVFQAIFCAIFGMLSNNQVTVLIVGVIVGIFHSLTYLAPDPGFEYVKATNDIAVPITKADFILEVINPIVFIYAYPIQLFLIQISTLVIYFRLKRPKIPL